MKNRSYLWLMVPLLLAGCGATTDSIASSTTEVEESSVVLGREKISGDWTFVRKSDVDSKLRELGVSPFQFIQCGADECEFGNGKEIRSYNAHLSQQCPAITSPFEIVRSSTGNAPEIAKVVQFDNYVGKENFNGIAIIGDLVVFDGGKVSDLSTNYDRILGEVGNSCKVKFYDFDQGSKCTTYEPELRWNYDCARKAFLSEFADRGEFETSLGYREVQDTLGRTFPMVVLATMRSTRTLLSRTSFYGFSHTLGTTYHLTFEVFRDDYTTEFASDLDQKNSKIAAAILGFFQQEMDLLS